MNGKIHQYFERFGEVECLRVHFKNDFHYGFVQFKMAECANAALSMASHRIGTSYVKVKEADIWHQPDYEPKPEDPLLVPPAQDSPANILNKLDDDCIREIFRFFKAIDLCIAAQVCTRFNRHANDMFSAKYKELDMYDAFDKMLSKNETEALLRNFGALIHSLVASSGRVASTNQFLIKVNNYCAHLKVLNLSGFRIFGVLYKKLRPLFAALEKLTLKDCKLSDNMKALFGVCGKLKSLDLTDCNMSNGKCIKQTFPALEEVSFVRTDGLKNHALNTFIASNTTVKKLKIDDNSNPLSTEIFHLIGVHLAELTDLEIGEIEFNDSTEETHFLRDVQFLSHLKSLKVLKINLQSYSMFSLVSSLAANDSSIEHLELHESSVDGKAIEKIAQLKQIKILKVSQIDLTDEHLILLAKGLPQLHQLHLYEASDEVSTIGIKKMISHAKRLSMLKIASMDNIEIDVDDYKAMLKHVQNRPEKLKLSIEITGHGGKVDVPEEILRENREWLHIDEQIDDLTISYDSNDSFDDIWDEMYGSDSDYIDYFTDADSEEGYGGYHINGGFFYLG